MAQVTTQKLVEGPNHLTLQINLLSDGSGELIDFPIFTPGECNPPLAANRPQFIIREAWYGLVWFDVTLKFNGVTPFTVWTFARDCDSHIDFTKFGGLVQYQKVPPENMNGSILFSTNGFGTAGSQGTIVLDLRKIGS